MLTLLLLNNHITYSQTKKIIKDTLLLEEKKFSNHLHKWKYNIIEKFGDERFYHPQVEKACFSNDEKLLATYAEDVLKIWDIKSAKLIKEHLLSAVNFCFSTCKNELYVMTENKLLFLDSLFNITDTLKIRENVCLSVSGKNEIILCTTDSVFFISPIEKIVTASFLIPGLKKGEEYDDIFISEDGKHILCYYENSWFFDDVWKIYYDKNNTELSGYLLKKAKRSKEGKEYHIVNLVDTENQNMKKTWFLSRVCLKT